MTEQLPEEERHNLVDDYLRDRLTILLAGRGAEKQLFNNTSSGAADDLQQATKLARHMVMNWGMSDALGPVGYRAGEAHPFLGMELSEPKEYSEATAELIDQEVRKLLTQAETLVSELLGSHAEQLQQLIDALLKHESLDRQHLIKLLGDPSVDRAVCE